MSPVATEMQPAGAPPTAGPDRRHPTRTIGHQHGVWIALALLVLANVVLTDDFLTLSTLQVNLTQMATIVIAAMGMTMIMATGGIDLSVGSLMAIAGAASGYLLLSDTTVFGGGWSGVLLIVAVGMLAAALFGSFNGFLVAHLRIQAIVATLVLLIAGRGIARLMTNGRLFTFDNPELLLLGRGQIAGLPIQALIMVAVVVVTLVLVRLTTFGRYVIATGGNERSAHLAGVPVRRVKYLVYTIGGALAGLAGLLSVAVNGTVDAANLGLGIEFPVIAAVAIGGTRLTGGNARVLGTLGGAALMQLLAYTLIRHDIPKEVANLVQAAVIVAAVAMQRRKRV
ncbi:ABC transporter permease [Micromonospora sp. CPCC 206060]|uniref:ABC transporter permease n=1 Tax=Micromonospora sp. CPCC 206060 TaxID=3122406 RepID=UPI002FF24194